MEPLKRVFTESIIRDYQTASTPLLVLGDDYNQYVVKSGQGKYPAYYLISEFLSYYLLKLWGIPTPEAVVITVDPEDIEQAIYDKKIASLHKKHFYKNICFGSSLIARPLEMQQFFDTKDLKSSYLLNPETFLKIALFDIWIENEDRKPTNYNLLAKLSGNKYELYAIDHSFTFATLNYGDLNPKNGVTKTVNDCILYCEFAKKLCKQYQRAKRDIRKEMEEYFYLCREESVKNFDLIAAQIPHELGINEHLIDSLKAFLFNEDRNQVVLQEFRLRLIV